MVNNYWHERNKPYIPGQKAPFKISRSKIELFIQCPRCFWLDVRHKITRPNSPPFKINQAIDELFKKEFDVYRKQGKPHPLMVEYQIPAIPYQNDNINTWRETFVGVVSIHQPTNLHIFGAVDDLWLDQDQKVVVVDYKATAKDQEVNIDANWQMSYKRQMEVYQWLLRANGLTVSDTGYFVYANARLDMDGFNNKIEFQTKVIPYMGDDSWIEPTLLKLKKCMDDDNMPPPGDDIMGGECKYCAYSRSRTELTLKYLKTI